jgi:plasmid stability protein
MPNLNIRRLDEETMRRLRVRAAQRGRSMEEEARQILRAAVATAAAGDDYWTELRRRAKARAAGRPQSDSTALIREDRDR